MPLDRPQTLISTRSAGFSFSGKTWFLGQVSPKLSFFEEDQGYTVSRNPAGGHYLLAAILRWIGILGELEHIPKIPHEGPLGAIGRSLIEASRRKNRLLLPGIQVEETGGRLIWLPYADAT